MSHSPIHLQVLQDAHAPTRASRGGCGSRASHPPDPVLATLRADGRRNWIWPRLSQGFYWHRRRIVAYVLMAIFVTLPWLSIAGKLAVLLDLMQRRFTLLGFTFLPTDTVLLTLFMLAMFLLIFFATAVLGRAWCGWACPQTVYLEFLFRPLERLFTGTTGRGGKPKNVAAWRYITLYAVYTILCFALANTFLAYFVGLNNLRQWMVGSPTNHPLGFLLVTAVTGLMIFDFAFFREQMCSIACPYGRFQSVMLDRGSLVVSYDEKRGEPRGKAKAADVGDCVDCTLCVQACPAGIDIRNGLQMECIHCAQCIDACDSVMLKLGRDTGLIGYASEDRRAGVKRHFRPRLVLYPAAILIVAVLWLVNFQDRTSLDVTVLRSLGRPFEVMDDGRIANALRVKVVNRADVPHTYALTLEDERLELMEDEQLTLAPGKTAIHPVRIIGEPQVISGLDEASITVTDDAGASQTRSVPLLAPAAAL